MQNFVKIQKGVCTDDRRTTGRNVLKHTFSNTGDLKTCKSPGPVINQTNKVNKKRKKEAVAHESPPVSPKKFKSEEGGRDKKVSKKSQDSLVQLVRNAKNSSDVYSPPEEDFTPVVEPVFSSDSFTGTEVHPYMVSNLAQSFGITQMTEVQKMSIPELVSGKDALIRSQTGSGKTLAYAIPIIQMLQKIRPKISREDGTRALVILPTRELAMQTYECFQKLVRSFAWLVPGILVGGEKRKSEKARLRRGITILVGTPGRLLDHAHHTKTLSFHNLTYLVLDEADRLLDLGYEKDVAQLMEIIDSHRAEQSRLVKIERRQTVLLSATLTRGVERLAGLALTEPQRIDASDADGTESHSETNPDLLVIPESLNQYYLVCPARLRLVSLTAVLSHFIKVEGCHKALVFMATQDMVDYHTALFSSVLPSLASFFQLHGNMSQVGRTEVFKKFRASSSGVLICTDVGARGLDLPKVDCIVQYTAPCTPADYVHRVGRTARVGNIGSAVVCLSPSESSFVDLLSSRRIKVNEYDLGTVLDSVFKLDLESERKIRDLEDACSLLQLKFEQAVLAEKELHSMASVGYQSFVRFYASYPKDYREVFNFKNLQLGHYAKSFALRDAPSTISGIGRPNFKANKGSKKEIEKANRKRNEPFKTEFKKPFSQTISEYDSGIKFKNKK